MKKISVLMVVALAVAIQSIKAQELIGQPSYKIIQSMPLMISNTMTTNLIFPYGIRSVDRGSRDILVQKAKGTENILQIKGLREAFGKTNLSVVTEDGHLYSFLLSYTPLDLPLNLEFTKDSVRLLSDKAANIKKEQLNIAHIEAVCSRVEALKADPPGLRDKHFSMSLNLKRIVIDEDVLYFKVIITNHSFISYDVEDLRFFIKDKKEGRRTASQDEELTPLLVSGNKDVIQAKNRQVLVIALPKFTIPDKKLLYLQVMEKDGGRHLQLKIKNKRVIRAEPVKELR